MKRIITLALAALLTCSFAYAASNEVKETRQTLRERKLIGKLAKSELNQKAGKTAAKEAKRLAKEGWVVAPGQLPLPKQLDKSYMMYYEYEDNGLPKYILADAKSVGGSYDAARMQAINNAKIELAGLIQTEVTALTESTVGNSEMTPEDAASINEAVQAGKTLIAQRLGRTVIAMQCYRNLKDQKVEVSIHLAYNSKMAMEAANEVIKLKLEETGKDLHGQLDAMWGTLEK